MKELKNLKEVNSFIKDNMINIVMFTTTTCVVCHPLKEKIIKRFANEIPLASVMVDDHKEVASSFGIYSAPITILFVDGKEISRHALALDINELALKVERFKDLLRD